MRIERTTRRRTEDTLLVRVTSPCPMSFYAVALYDPKSDPWSIRLLVPSGLSTGPARPLSRGCYWVVARDLLAAGLREDVGCPGELTVRPISGGRVQIAHGLTVVCTRAAPLAAFLGRTYIQVLPGDESAWANPDRQLAALNAA